METHKAPTGWEKMLAGPTVLFPGDGFAKTLRPSTKQGWHLAILRQRKHKFFKAHLHKSCNLCFGILVWFQYFLSLIFFDASDDPIKGSCLVRVASSATPWQSITCRRMGHGWQANLHLRRKKNGPIPTTPMVECE